MSVAYRFARRRVSTIRGPVRSKLEARPRHGTLFSSAIHLGAKLIEPNACFGVRRILDLSDDGHNNTGLPIAHARNDALARGIRPTTSTVPLDWRQGGLFAEHIRTFGGTSEAN
ncbi:DUF1194 domain-containing protein [Ensifer sp. HO-A22]|uniref:DUF1194 domain-containing protein n=1 Tax=Ensifer oleiphilus TaxID=2742698 RepID=A0A7Y6QAD0_9HYPH|nr:DUF1194 domain-containing protein [Ensifer oleiphilus]NVD41921.1 DUF1194 domain-containing protein [Ensifer oleiphilus]